jgi:D-tyrosyl-tRNA(Tyr) deacylase
MICVVQRVSSGSVRVGEGTVGAIGEGVLALIGVVPEDDDADVAYIAERLSTLRIFADAEGRMNLSVQDVGGALLLVPQFTLAADTRRGRRPSFSGAAPPAQGQRLFDALVAMLKDGPVPVQTGEFGASMEVHLVNDGPVTLILDSAHRRERVKGESA